MRNDKCIYIDEEGNEYDNLKSITQSGYLYIDDSGNEYHPEKLESLQRLKSVPSNISPLTFYKTMSLSERKKFYYELDKTTFNRVHRTFMKLNPRVSAQLKNNTAWTIGGGLKNHIIYDNLDPVQVDRNMYSKL